MYLSLALQRNKKKPCSFSLEFLLGGSPVVEYLADDDTIAKCGDDVVGDDRTVPGLLYRREDTCDRTQEEQHKCDD